MLFTKKIKETKQKCIWIFTSDKCLSKRASVQSLSHVRLFATLWTAAHQASLSITNSWSLLELMSFVLVMPSNHLIFCCPLLLLPSIFSSIRVFSSESVLYMNIQDWFPLGSIGLISLLSKGLSGISPTPQSKASVLRHQSSLWSKSHIYTWLLVKP